MQRFPLMITDKEDELGGNVLGKSLSPVCVFARVGFCFSFTNLISYVFLVVAVIGPGLSPAVIKVVLSSSLVISWTLRGIYKVNTFVMEMKTKETTTALHL